MKKQASFAVLLLCFSNILSLNGFSQFREIYNGPNDDNSISSMHFISASTGFATFGNHIRFTADSGRTFIQRPINSGNTNFNGYQVNQLFGFRAKQVYAFTADSVLVTGEYGTEPSILFSTNQGQTWKLVQHENINQNAPVNNMGITDIEFPGNGNIGFAVHHDEILKTNNRGQSWFPLIYIAGAELRKLAFVNSSTGFATGVDRCYKTINGGTSWTPVNLPATGNFNNISFVNNDVGYITNQDNNSIYKTENAGAGWMKMNDPLIEISGDDMHFINDSTGFIISEGYNVFKTSDHGKTWEICKKNTTYQLAGKYFTNMFFLNAQTIWAGGDGEYIMLSTSGTPVTPRAVFQIDSTNLPTTGVIDLINHSKPTYQYRWYRNGNLFNTNYHSSYTHIPGTATDTIKLVVSNGADSSENIQYIYFEPPVEITTPSIISFTPSTASFSDIVTIKGHRFNGAVAVKFGGVNASSFFVISDTVITAVVDIGASGAVTVITSFGTASASGFTYTNPSFPLPSITSFSPQSGPVGTLVTITGNNFNTTAAMNTVHFGGARAAVINATATHLQVQVPYGAMYKPITVKNGPLKASSAIPFLVTFAGGGSISQSSFAQPVKFSGTLNSNTLCISDMDGDGKADYITSSKPDRVVSISRNLTTGNNVVFAPPFKIDFTLQPTPYDINGTVLGDFDGDGLDDIFIVPDYFAQVSVFKNISTPGSFAFGNRIDIPIPLMGYYFNGGPRTMGVADINKDGKLDVYVYAAYDPGRLTIFQNTSVAGHILFTPVIVPQMTMTPCGSICAEDVDNDGRIDLVFEGGTRIQILRNLTASGNISFEEPIEIPFNGVGSISMADLDADGKFDMIIGNENDISLRKNTSTPGNISFTHTISYPLPQWARMSVITDIDGDGRPDIAIATTDYPAPVSFIKNLMTTPGIISMSGKIDFTQVSRPNDMAIADMDNDGKPDISYINFFDSTIGFLKNMIGNEDTMRFCPPLATGSLYANLSGSVYQWQLDTGTGFSNLQNNSTYSGTNTAELQFINLPTSSYGYKYRCVVNGVNDKRTTIVFENRWIGFAGNDWFNSANWLCGSFPDGNTDVIIGSNGNSDIIIYANAICRKLTIYPGSSVTIAEGYQLIITH